MKIWTCYGSFQRRALKAGKHKWVTRHVDPEFQSGPALHYSRFVCMQLFFLLLLFLP